MSVYFVSVRGFIKGTDKFPIQKCAIFRKFKEIGGIAEKDHLWTETSLYADIIDDTVETPADHLRAVSIYRKRSTVRVGNFKNSRAAGKLTEQAEGIRGDVHRASDKTGLLSFHNQNKVCAGDQ